MVDSSVPTPDPLTVYCPGCNAAFGVLSPPPACPRCGMSLLDNLLATLPTLLFRTGDWAGLPAGALDHRLSQLVNQQFGNYDILSLLGRGGMGWVFLATHRTLGRPCALKILAPHLADRDPEYLERFHTEGQAAAALNHPHVVTVHAIGEQDGLHFLEMEFLQGRSLQAKLKAGALPPYRSVSLALGIAQGLASAHEMGVLHRDLKPDNVLLTHKGMPKLADFGLCKRLHVPSLSGALAGTPHFMAPELFQGVEASKASDVYALGVCLFFLLAGKLPFHASDLNELMRAVVHDPLPAIRALNPETPLEVAEALAMLLDKTPGNRPQDGVAATQLLQAVLGHLDDLETLLHEALEFEPHVQWHRIGGQDAFMAEVLLQGGRHQTVLIEVSTDELSERVVRISSVCCAVQPEFYATALRLNSHLDHGAVCITQRDGREFFEVVNAYPRATVDPEELRRSILQIAHHADDIERRLTGLDIY